MKKAAVIGAGPSGITALKNLLDEGMDAVAFDRQEDVGGNWIFSEKEGHSSVFETTHIISSKTLSQYEDFTFDDFEPGIPDYPSHDQLRRYFRAYARHFDLYPHIRFNTTVKRCTPVKGGGWEVTTEKNGVEETEFFDCLAVCNGHHWDPRMPEYPGAFAGEFMHSHSFKRAAPFTGKRVLVIGGGNSACDVAVETSRVSDFTAISMRRGYRIIPKFFFGEPSDKIGEKGRWIPLKIRSFLFDALLKILIGPNKKYGLPEAETKFGQVHPTINDELLYKIRHGKVHPRGDIEKFDGSTVVFKDGRREDYDAVVACTGYRITHPFFDKDLIDYSSGKVPLYLRMLHPKYTDLYFIGMFQPIGCIWPGAELQSKIMARELAGKWKRPQNTAQKAKSEAEHPHFNQIDTPRHTITVDYHLFRKELLKELPRDYVQRNLKLHKKGDSSVGLRASF
ncbi:MAG: flavin-containing monooxygenase [Cryomorphaceae bacterium]